MDVKKGFAIIFVWAGFVGSTVADGSYQVLPFLETWTPTERISSDGNWSAVPGVMGYSGSGLVSAAGVDPQAILAPGGMSPSLVANKTNPSTLTTGGVAEFHLTDPVVALQGSGSANAPFLLFFLATRGWQNVNVSYVLRDVDGSADNSVQPVALQYRLGDAGNFINLPSAFVADATTGPSLATLTTPVSVVLPAAASNLDKLQLRVITADAVGSDEWVGVDDFKVFGTAIAAIPEPSTWMSLLAGLCVVACVAHRRLRNY